MPKLPWFQISIAASFVVLCGVMGYCVFLTLKRPTSGVIGIDAAKIQVMRLQANEELKAASREP